MTAAIPIRVPVREKDRKVGDPGFIGKRGKAASMRKGRYDGSWTPSEQRKRDQLMKQFCSLEGVNGNTAAYRNSACWCACGRGMNRRGADGVTTVPCVRCEPHAEVA